MYGHTDTDTEKDAGGFEDFVRMATHEISSGL